MRLTCEVLRLKLMQAHLSPLATKRTSWSDFSSTRQATYKDCLVSPRCYEVPNRLSLSPWTARTMRIRTRPLVSRYLLAALGPVISTPTPDGSSETSEDSLGDQAVCEEALDVAPPRVTRRQHQRPEQPAVSRAWRTLCCSPEDAARNKPNAQCHGPRESALSRQQRNTH